MQFSWTTFVIAIGGPGIVIPGVAVLPVATATVVAPDAAAFGSSSSSSKVRAFPVIIAEIGALLTSAGAIGCDICQRVLDKTQDFLQQHQEDSSRAIFPLRDAIRNKCKGCDLTTGPSSVPWCLGFDDSSARPLVSFEAGSPEALAFDAAGRLVFSDYLGGQLRVLEAPGSQPWTLDSGLQGPGGLAAMPDGSMLSATGISVLSTLAPAVAMGKLYRYNMTTGARTTVATGLSQGNGLVRVHADGTVFASDDAAHSMDRIAFPDGAAVGKTTTGWYRGSSTNGLAVSADSSTLYTNLAFGRTGVLAWDLRSGSAVPRTFWQAPDELAWAVMDDLDVDPSGRLYATVWAAGEVWRIEADGSSACALSKGRPFSAGMSLGPRYSNAGHSYSDYAASRFASDSVYFTTHLGAIYEIPRAVPVSSAP